jgi:endonuclease/exonuclease/phosphatase family metal-dependent hydrolase
MDSLCPPPCFIILGVKMREKEMTNGAMAKRVFSGKFSVCVAELASLVRRICFPGILSGGVAIAQPPAIGCEPSGVSVLGQCHYSMRAFDLRNVSANSGYLVLTRVKKRELRSQKPEASRENRVEINEVDLSGAIGSWWESAWINGSQRRLASVNGYYRGLTIVKKSFADCGRVRCATPSFEGIPFPQVLRLIGQSMKQHFSGLFVAADLALIQFVLMERPWDGIGIKIWQPNMKKAFRMKIFCKLIVLSVSFGILVGSSSHGATVVFSDNYNVAGSGTGFALNTGINSGINPPTTRLNGTAAANLRYLNTGTKASSAYAIAGNQIEVASAANPGRFVLSADGTTSFNFASALGTSSANATNRMVYDLAIKISNDSSGGQRCSFAIGTIEGDANSWSFGFQVYRTNSGNNYYAIGKRVDTTSSGLGSDLNKPILILTPNTYGSELTLLMRVTDAGSETSTYNSRVQLSLNGGNSWFYDTDTDPDLLNGWRLNGVGRHIMWDVAPDAGPVTFDAFSMKLNPPLNDLNTSSTFRAMSYNIHAAVGPDGKVNTQRIADFILAENVDLVALNEVARFMPRSDGRDTIGELAQQTGMTYVFSNNNTALSGNDEFGNAILSKYPILYRDHKLLPNIGSNEQRGLLKMVVDVNGKFVCFWATHLDFHADDTERLMCVTNFNTWVGQEMFPVIIAGDFNETPDKTIHDRMDLKWDDVWLLAGDGGSGRTSPCPGPLQTRIDFIWKAQASTSIKATNAYVGYNVEASDHFPVLSQFILTNFTNHKTGFSFPFDEGTGAKSVDSVGGLSGKIEASAPSWSTNSPSGQSSNFSLFFNGSKTLTITDTNQIIGTNGLNDDYSLQAWVKLPVNYAPSERAILFQYERRPGFSFSINTNRTLHMTTFKIKDISSSATVPNDGNWHHVAVVHTDGVNMKFYIDAALAATVGYTNGAGYRTSPVITVGSDETGAHPFTGYLDRIRFEQRALTPAQFDFPSGGSDFASWGAVYGISDPNGDADGDKQNNYAEYVAGTNPTNAVSIFKILDGSHQADGRFSMTWTSVGGKRYRVQYTNGGPGGGLKGGFTDIVRDVNTETDAQPSGQASTQTFTDDSSPTNAVRYYRIKVVP